jgi:biofilm PGA synthesis protein PgaA
MGQPERAEQLLQLALQQTPDDAGLLTTLFYNQLDRELYDEAGQTLARLQEISGEPVVNGRATWTARLAALFEAYQNHLQVAQERLEALRIHALNDPDLDLNLATIYRWRGWSAKALEEYNKAEADGADALAVETGRAQALFDLRRFDEADAKIAELVKKAPAHPDTIALQSQWDWFNKYLYIAQAQTGQSDANPVTGSSDLVFDQWLYSKPIANHYRVFAHHHYEWADFIEGPGGANRTGIGGDYRSEPYDVAVSLNRRSPGSRMGLTINGEYRPDEQWTVFGDVQTDSQAVPLRGTRAGVDGHSGSIGVAYRWDERRNARASFSRADFSDGNVRETVSATLNQVIWVDARNSLMLSGDLYYSHASAGENVAYYNPASDRSAYLSADLSTILSRNADRTWSQRVNVGAGMHEQQNFSSRPIWSAQYEQRWQFGPSFGVNYGAMYRSRVYEGERERYGALFGGIQWRF